MCILISIDGNIGSGKSTVVKYLRDKYKNSPFICFVDEPVNEWVKIKDEEGIDIISKFYNNTEKYAFSFQMMAYISRVSVLKKTIRENPGKIIISERSIFTDKEIFAKMLYDDKLIEKVNYEIYLKWFEEFSEGLEVNTVIYINTDPKKCDERIKKRNRTGEDIELSYLEKCDKYHNDWMKKLDCDKLEFDGNEDKTNLDDYKDWIEKIDNYCRKTLNNDIL